MSQRQQRRVAQLAASRAPAAADSSEEDDAPEPLAAPQGRSALFSLLQGDSSDSDDGEDEEGRALLPEVPENPGQESAPPAPALHVPPSSAGAYQRQGQPAARKAASSESDDEFADAALPDALQQSARLGSLDSLLLLAGPSRANGDAELARVFGLREGERRGGGAPGRKGVGCSLVSPPPPETGRTRSPWPFVAAPGAVAGGLSMQATSPPHAPVRCFTVVRAPEYDRLVDAFEMVAGTGDTQLLMNFAQANPFVLPCLLALVEYHATARAAESAALHLRRALYVVERMLHPSFRPSEVPCRLALNEGSRPLYTVLFKAQASAARSGAIEASFELCRLLLQLSPPSDAPDGTEEGGGDPLRVALLAGTAALRAGADAWVIAVTGVEATGGAGAPPTYVCLLRGSTLPLVHLPGWGIARARALFRVQEQGGGSGGPAPAPAATVGGASVPTARSAWLHADPSFLVIPAGAKGGLDPATRTLMRSLLLLPHLLLPLLTGLGLKAGDRGIAAVLGDAAAGTQRVGREGTPDRSPLSTPTCAWKVLFDHPLFAEPWREYERVRSGSGTSPRWPGGLEHLVTIAARRHALVWRSGPALLWLHASAVLACNAHDAASALMGRDEGADVAAAAEALTARELFNELWVSFIPHAGGDDTTDAQGAALHAALRHYGRAGPLAEYTDELPTGMDVEEMEGAEWGGNARAPVGQGARGRGQGCCRSTAAWGRKVAGGNPVLLFFASLLPGYAL